MNKIDYALDALSRGFSVFPLKPGLKEPANQNGFKGSTNDPEEVKRIWAANPHLNIGAYPGEGLVVVDVDCKSYDGESAFCEYVQKEIFDYADMTMVCNTPSGGYHIIFKADQPYASGANVGGLKGVDVRAVGGYIVYPGSELIQTPKHCAGQYRMLSSKQPALVPDEVRGFLRVSTERKPTEYNQEAVIELDTRVAVKRAKEYLESRLPAVEGAGGNAWTYQTIAVLKDFGLSRERALGMLMEPDGWNSRCMPEWSLEELSNLAANVYKYGRNAPGEDAEPDFVPEFTALTDIGEELKDSPAGLRSIAYFGSSIIGRKSRREYIVPGWMRSSGFTGVVAKRGEGKSTIILDLALRMACDMDWHGLPVQPGRTAVYLCGEDDEGVETFITAWCEKHEVDYISEDRFLVMTQVPDLMSEKSVHMYTSFLTTAFGDESKCVLFVDTWQRATFRAGQSKDEEMQFCVHAIEGMANRLNAPAVIAFHPPKNGEGIMGSGVMENHSTALWHLESTAVGRKLYVERIKGKGAGNELLFDFEEIDIGEVDEFGENITSVIPVKIGGLGSGKAVVDDKLVKLDVLARFIAALDKHRNNETHNTGPYTYNTITMRVMGSPDPSKPWKGKVLIEEALDISCDTKEWASSTIAPLYMHKIRLDSPVLFTEMLKDFFPVGTKYKIDDQVSLFVEQAGNRINFRVGV